MPLLPRPPGVRAGGSRWWPGASCPWGGLGGESWSAPGLGGWARAAGFGVGSRRAGSGLRSSRLCRGGVGGGSGLASGRGAKPLVVRGWGAAARGHSCQPPRGLPALHQQGAALQPTAVETRPSPRQSWWAQLRRQPRLWLLHSPRPRIGAKAPPSLWEPPAGCSGSLSSACMTGPLARPGQGWFPVVGQQFPWSPKQGLRSRTRDHPLRETDAGGHAAIATPRAAPLWGSVGGPCTAPLPV